MNKKYNIAVAGTGYVGLGIATLLAQHHKVQSADSNRRFCGAKRTRCGVSGLTSIIEIY